MAAVFVSLVVALTLLMVVVVPPSGSLSLLGTELIAAVVAAGVLALVVERWKRSRIVDLRHNDLAESFRHGLIPKEPELPEGAVRGQVRSQAVPSGMPPQHRLFGDCDCAECASGLGPGTVDLRDAEAPSPGASPDDGRRTSSF